MTQADLVLIPALLATRGYIECLYAQISHCKKKQWHYLPRRAVGRIKIDVAGLVSAWHALGSKCLANGSFHCQLLERSGNYLSVHRN